jgi:hypothetical protein
VVVAMKMQHEGPPKSFRMTKKRTKKRMKWMVVVVVQTSTQRPMGWW